MTTPHNAKVQKENIPGETSKLNKSGPGKIKKFFTKYFLEGQKLSEKQTQAIANLDENAPWSKKVMVKYRKEIGILIPFLFFQITWWCLAIRHDFFSKFGKKNEATNVPNYVLSITMIFGALIGGMTSEGGGAVAYPVMTLALKIPSPVARDFSMMIQSCGLTAAAFTILWMKIKLEWHSIIFCSLGAIFGLIFGIEVVDKLPGAEKKLTFVCIFFTFAFALFLLNREHKRKTYNSIRNFGIWQGVALLFTGFFGGIFTGISGSGVDICSFSMLCLLFRVSEKVATPTSIVLMAINTSLGFSWRLLMDSNGFEAPDPECVAINNYTQVEAHPQWNGTVPANIVAGCPITVQAWTYLIVCIPIVVFFAPVGSFLSSYFHRQVLASLIYILDTVALIGAFAVIPMTTKRGILVGCLLTGGIIFFFVISKIGQKLQSKHEAKMEAEKMDTEKSETKKERNEGKTTRIRRP